MGKRSKIKTSKPLILGAHLSISGGLHKSLIEGESLGCNALQIFTKNASTWQEKQLIEKQILDFSDAKNQTGIRYIASHAPYLINLASSNSETREKSTAALEQELIRCGQLDLNWLVMHPGSHTGDGVNTGIKRIVDAINRIFDRLPDNPTRLLLETTAGQGNSIGHTFEQLAEIMYHVSDKNRIGICLDTCHIFAAGYPIADAEGYARTMAKFDVIIGIDRLFVIHVNDAKRECGSRVDRHTHIGEGTIGLKGFSLLVNDKRLIHIPKIIETPKKKNNKNADPLNLKKLRSLANIRTNTSERLLHARKK